MDRSTRPPRQRPQTGPRKKLQPSHHGARPPPLRRALRDAPRWHLLQPRTLRCGLTNTIGAQAQTVGSHVGGQPKGRRLTDQTRTPPNTRRRGRDSSRRLACDWRAGGRSCRRHRTARVNSGRGQVVDHFGEGVLDAAAVQIKSPQTAPAKGFRERTTYGDGDEDLHSGRAAATG